jgi:hypothetical protein
MAINIMPIINHQYPPIAINKHQYPPIEYPSITINRITINSH